MCGMGDGARIRVRRGAAALATAVALGVSGCATASEPSPPSGVDQLVIPTPSVDPDDFVAEVDNRWLPLTAGATWSYELSAEQSGTVTVSVSEEPRTAAGLSATVVETSWPDRRRTDYYAQDREGNVWWLGREGFWEAGVDGAEAGLAMAADPRVGDGYRMAAAEGVVEDRALVRSVSAEVTVPAGEYADCVEIETSSPLVPGVRLLSTYADGVGLVRTVSLEGPEVSLELVTEP